MLQASALLAMKILIRLTIRLSQEATLKGVYDSMRAQCELELVGQVVRRGEKAVVIHVVSEGARPLNAFCRRLTQNGLAETVTAQRLDV